MSQAVDPSLELQQLASQALNYHQEQQIIPQYSSPTITADTIICPFPLCSREYKRKDLLKRHLTTLLASPDENHGDQELWDTVRESGIMTVYTRPRNLSEDQKKMRRKESNLRHRIKYANQLKEKRNRKRRVEKLLEGKAVGTQTPDWGAEAREQAAALNASEVNHAVVQPQFVAEVKARGGGTRRVNRRSG
jgi:hypothetical protein